MRQTNGATHLAQFDKNGKPIKPDDTRQKVEMKGAELQATTKEREREREKERERERRRRRKKKHKKTTRKAECVASANGCCEYFA